LTRPADALRDNLELWDEWTRIHETSTFYDLVGFKRGGIRLRPYELDEFGRVEGLDLLHLQCHFGIDTPSWAAEQGPDPLPQPIRTAVPDAVTMSIEPPWPTVS
jgi:hypothetical protein